MSNRSSPSAGAQADEEAVLALERMRAIVAAMAPTLLEDDRSFAENWIEDVLANVEQLVLKLEESEMRYGALETETRALQTANQKLLAEKRRVELSNLNMRREMSGSRDGSFNGSREASPVQSAPSRASQRPALMKPLGSSTPPPQGPQATHDIPDSPPHSSRAVGKGVGAAHGATPHPPPILFDHPPFACTSSAGGGDTSARSLEMSGVYVGGGTGGIGGGGGGGGGPLHVVSSRHLPCLDAATAAAAHRRPGAEGPRPYRASNLSDEGYGGSRSCSDSCTPEREQPRRALAHESANGARRPAQNGASGVSGGGGGGGAPARSLLGIGRRARRQGRAGGAQLDLGELTEHQRWIAVGCVAAVAAVTAALITSRLLRR